jgi:hypothetical protein
VQLVCASHCEQSRVSVEWPGPVSSLYGDPAGLDGMGGLGPRSHVNVGCRQGGPGR